MFWAKRSIYYKNAVICGLLGPPQVAIALDLISGIISLLLLLAVIPLLAWSDTKLYADAPR